VSLQTFFYDGQIRRFITQFIRILSNFQVQYGRDSNGNNTLVQVPVYYGDASRQAQTILRQNSEGALNTVPAIAVYMSALSYERARMQEPNFVDKLHVRQRAVDPNTGEYLTTQGNTFTIERLMPVPYKLTMKADIWTSNTDQKLQILEQLSIFFNPAMEIQSTDNYVDWGSLSYVELTDINLTSRSIPVGTENPIDVATMTFEMPIWISPPAKVKKLGVIQKIITSVYDASGDISESIYNDGAMLARLRITLLNYGVLVGDGVIQLLKIQDTIDPQDPRYLELPSKVGTPSSWRELINVYGALTNGISEIKLLLADEETQVVGTVSYHPSNETLLLYGVDEDTLPTNNLPAILSVIDPQQTAPSVGLITPALGQRYLITKPIGDVENTDPSNAWGNLVASTNDIIEFTGTEWIVGFQAASTDTDKYLLNQASNTQLHWNGTSWSRSYQGEYKGGFWTLVL
jgi:hypothetical protein